MTAPSTAKTPTQSQPRDSKPTSAAATPNPVKARRNTRLMLVGVVLAVLCGLLAVWAVNRAGTPRSVVVITKDVAAGDQINKSDLGTTQVNGGEDLATVPADKLRSLVGQRANTALPAGSLANESAFTTRVTARSGHVILGVRLATGQYPETGLQKGDVVRLVPTADAKDPGAAGDSVGAVVLAVGKADSDGQRTVDLSVANADADMAAKAAGTEKVAILNVAPGGTGVTAKD